MTRKKQPAGFVGEIDPGGFYRTTLAPVLFGVGWQSCRYKILAGEIPTPFGNPQGWSGEQIISYRERMQAAAEAKVAADAARPRQAQPAAFKKVKKKTQKVKLRARA